MEFRVRTVRRLPRLAVAALACLTVASCGSAAAHPPRQPAAPPAPTAVAATPAPSRDPVERITYPERGHGTWVTAPAGTGPAIGRRGKLYRYRVVVERDIHGLPVASFAAAVRATLTDPRGWTADGRWRFRQVGPGEAYDLIIYLVTPGTRDWLCDDVPDGYTSCRNGAAVVLNVARWVKGAKRFGPDLAAYRRYMVNHEVGHRLGHGHQLCAGEGTAAPVMQQQTLGLHGCEANPWPYPTGKDLNVGPSGQYDDRPPARDRGNR